MVPEIAIGRLGGRWMEPLASLKLSALILAWLVVGLPLSARDLLSATLVVGLAGGLFLVNLGAYLARSPAFGGRPGLVVFHLSLALFLLLAGLGRMTWLEGHVEVASGETFEGTPMQVVQGPWHAGGLERVRFVNEGFLIDYGPELKRGPTRNRVRWRDERGAEVVGIIGDDTPLILDHYRFYTTSNKGFAPVFVWRPEGGEVVRAAFHLPSYPLFVEQRNDWRLPGDGPEIHATLELPEAVIDPARASRFRLPERHILKVGVGSADAVPLAPGGEITLPGGRLRYEGLTTWMGYRIHYDRTRPWLLASVVVAVAGLAWHFRDRFAARHWFDEGSVTA